MGFIELALLGIGLSMDAFAVTLCNSMVYKGIKKRKALLMPLLFGFFQGLMPFLGFYAGSFFEDFMNSYSGVIIFIILSFIGGKMVYEGLKDKNEACDIKPLTIKVLFFQAVATSIDAFAVGVALRAVGTDILSSCLIIAAITFICAVAALFLGKSFGNFLKSKADIFGGVILIFIGIKGLF